VSGYLGGTMVYDDGVGVGRHRRDTDPPRRTLNVSMFERQDGWVAVCNADDLKDGETLRIDWNGTIIAVARVGGEVYAFQEFCTHRFGPLSEGKLQDHEVECPWHRSCFDIRTGKVTQGPAKVDLKTYSAKVKDGKIFVG
jgi:nitrite reductase/ring-hydroxylating ferredoxin subunit